jgi:hypothetical protein
MKHWQLLLIVPLMLGGCDLDKARGSGATKHHADKQDKRDKDDAEWDQATGEEEEPGPTCATATPPTDPVCPGGSTPSRCVMYNGSPVWGC